MIVTGITLIKNGEMLRYPWRECINSMATYCDQVIVNCGESRDETRQELNKLIDNRIFKIRALSEAWSENNTGDGRELADQANACLKLINWNFPHKNSVTLMPDWIVYLQADEFIREDQGQELRRYLETLPPEISQVELYRTYFWGSLKQRATQHEIWLGRVFRFGTHLVGGDGMYLIRCAGEVARWEPGLIYHYSRIGPEKDITRRIRMLDRLFHSEEELRQMKDFSYNELSPDKLIEYNGPHPAGVELFYREK